ncbi:SprT family protein [Pediococcus pentosaceus]|uniref:SprT family protein n=1 Tax=Pediococcus pentosaceus TaxID=1255 RepID=UPI002017AF2C|nr:SprT family protein [Pediococcus pentosaceus]MCL3859196.1 SprT family protein [Pediococcus pentosaceus]
MTDLELQQLTQRIAQESFGKSFPYKVVFNRRLKTTGGRYHLNDHHIDINPLMLEEFDEATLIGVIKHELVHYFVHMLNEKPDHRNPHFQQLLRAVGGLRYAPTTSKRRRTPPKLLYQCQGCGLQYPRQRRINTRKYVCSKCHGRLKLL